MELIELFLQVIAFIGGAALGVLAVVASSWSFGKAFEWALDVEETFLWP